MQKPKLTGWAADAKLMKFEKAKKEKRQVMTQAIIAMVIAAILYITGWAFVSWQALVIALSIPIGIFGGAAFYGQVISEIPLNSNSGDQRPPQD